MEKPNPFKADMPENLNKLFFTTKQSNQKWRPCFSSFKHLRRRVIEARDQDALPAEIVPAKGEPGLPGRPGG